MKKIKKKSVFVTALMSMLLVSACSGGGEQPQASGSTKAKEGDADAITLTVAWWGSQTRHDATIKALEQYTALHPNVKFQSQFSGWDGYFDKLAVQFSANNAPDIIQMDAAYVNDYAGRELLGDLKSVNVSDMEPGTVNSGKVKDVQYAIPSGVAALGMVYDKSVVDKLGLTPPSFGWTWDDYFKFGEAAKAKLGSDKYVFVDQSSDLVDYTSYQYSMGKGYIFNDQNQLSIDKGTWIGYMTKMSELRDKGILTPADISTTDKELDPQLDSVVNGTAVARHLFSNQVGSIDALKPGAFEFASMPKGTESGGWLKPSMFWSANAQSKHQEESLKVIDWLLNDPQAGETLGLTRGTPVNKKVVESLTPKFSESDKVSLAFLETVTPDAQPFINDPKGWGSFKNDYKTVVEKVQFKQSTPEQAYEELLKVAGQYAAEAGK